MLGLETYPVRGDEVLDLIGAGKEIVTMLPGAVCFSNEESSGMIRAGKVVVTILGAVQVSGNKDLANWFVTQEGRRLRWSDGSSIEPQ